MNLEEHFFKIISKYQLIKDKERVILGISGGPDSVAMFHLFLKIKEQFRLKIICAHFNHQLREEADEDERFVQRICKEAGVEFVTRRKRVASFFKGNSLEQTARVLRFDFFFQCARQFRVKKVALAHNKDDLIETMLMRIIRGTALRGLRAIQPKIKMRGIFFVRPLIEIEKKEILDWLKENRIPYRVDKSNFEDKFFRNKIRMELVPFLERFNPSIKHVLFNLARVSSLDYEFLENFCQKEYQKIKKQKGREYLKLALTHLKKVEGAVLFNILRIAIKELKGDLCRLEFGHLEELVELIYNKPAWSRLSLPGVEAKKEEAWLKLQLANFGFEKN